MLSFQAFHSPAVQLVDFFQEVLHNEGEKNYDIIDGLSFTNRTRVIHLLRVYVYSQAVSGGRPAPIPTVKVVPLIFSEAESRPVIVGTNTTNRFPPPPRPDFLTENSTLQKKCVVIEQNRRRWQYINLEEFSCLPVGEMYIQLSSHLSKISFVKSIQKLCL